jgi:hypothetical protein
MYGDGNGFPVKPEPTMRHIGAIALLGRAL